MFGREIRTTLPQLPGEQNDDDLYKVVRATDAESKQKMKEYADDKQYVKRSPLDVATMSY